MGYAIVGKSIHRFLLGIVVALLFGIGMIAPVSAVSAQGTQGFATAGENAKVTPLTPASLDTIMAQAMGSLTGQKPCSTSGDMTVCIESCSKMEAGNVSCNITWQKGARRGTGICTKTETSDWSCQPTSGTGGEMARGRQVYR